MKNDNYSLGRTCTKAVIACLALLLAFAVNVQAQIMQRSTFTDAYVPLTTGGGATAATLAQADFGWQAAVPLGFTFNYTGTNYTTVGIGSDGFISFTATGN